MTNKKTTPMPIRLTDNERNALDRWAEKTGAKSAAGMMRLLIAQELDRELCSNLDSGMSPEEALKIKNGIGSLHPSKKLRGEI